MPRPDRGTVILLVLLALVLRVAVALFWAPQLTGDALDYLRLAGGLVRGEGLIDVAGRPTSWRPPLYPALIAPFVALSAHVGMETAQMALRLVQAVVSSLSVALVYYIAWSIFGRGVALVAGLLTTVSVVQVAAVSHLLTETVFVMMLLLALALLTWAERDGEPSGEKRRSRLGYLGAGLVLGAAALLRGVLLPFPFVVAGFLVVLGALADEEKPRLRGGGRAVLILVGFVVAVGPWTMRNYGVHGSFVPVSTQGGATLYAGNHPPDGYIMGLMADDERTRRAEGMSEVEASRYLAAMTLRDWSEEPGEAVRLAVLKMLYFWTPEDWEILPGEGVFNPTYAFIALWACVGAVLLSRRPGRSGDFMRRGWAVWLPVVYFVFIALIFYGSPRFRIPVEPLLAILAAVGICGTARIAGRDRAGPVIVGVALTVVGLGLAWHPMSAALKSALASAGAIR